MWQAVAAAAAVALEQAEMQLRIAFIDGTVQEQMWWGYWMDTGRFWLSVASDILGR